MRINTLLVRRRIRDTRLKTIQKKIGVRSQTDITIMYMEGIARPEIVRDIRERLELDQNELELIEHSVQEMETDCGMDRNAALADMRYNFIESVCRTTVVKCHESRERQRSEAIDRVVTNRYLALPIFFGIMLAIFFLTFNVIGAFLSDLLAAGIDALTAAVDAGLTAYGLNPVVHSCCARSACPAGASCPCSLASAAPFPPSCPPGPWPRSGTGG